MTLDFSQQSPLESEHPLLEPEIEGISETADEEVLVFPASLNQQQMWLLAQMEPESAYYNDPITLRLHGPLNVTALEQSLNRIIERHAIWRTSFVTLDGQPLQVIHPHLTLPLPLIDLRSLEPEQQEQEARRLATAQAKQPFNLAQAPLLRACLVRFSPTEHRLYLTLHHIIYDGISLYTVFLKELGQLYDAFCTQQPSPLPELTLQYADFAVWQRQWLDSEMLTPQKEYWKQQLANLPVLQLPADRPQPVVRSFRGARTKVALSQQLSEQLKTFSRQQEVTLFMTLMAAFQVLLYRYSGQEDLAVATVTSGRNRVEVAELIGCFVNTLVLRTDLSGAPSFQEVVQRVRRVTLEAYANQELPFEQVVQQLQPERKPGRQLLFRVMLEYLNVDSNAVQSSLNLELDFQDIHNGTAKFDLLFQLAETSEGIAGWLEYSTELFDAETIERLIGHFQTLLEGIVSNPTQPIAELPLLTPAERHQLAQWNQTFVDYSNPLCLHQLIEAQVERTPDAIAVVFEQEQLTYRALNQRANQLAAHLQTLGVVPDVLVGVCMERSLEMVVALLGVLKAGGAYVPLDPGYPQERLAFMLQDTQVPVLLTQSKLVQCLPQHQTPILCLDTDWQTLAQASDEPISSEVTLANLAYVIYTSGSTGKSKGTMNTHQGICNRLLWMQDAYQLTEHDRVLQKTPFSFDVSVWEFFWPLMTGACLVVACPEGHKDSAYLVQLIAEQQITTLHFVPPMLQVFLQEPNLKHCQCLKRVICSGEALSFQLQERFFVRLEAELYNLYGPTEAAIDVTAWTCQRWSDQQLVPIGRPIANMQIHLLDAHLNPVPIGVPGELHISGIGLARGYLNRPELTAEQFIPNPFAQNKSIESVSASERLYKTGDLARYLPDGNIEYLGRIDHQVKVRGFRIELGEIESTIQEYAEVCECVVVVREDVPGDKRLVAYLTTTGTETFLVSELRQYLQQKLPEFMVPSAFVLLETLPLTTNGKVDRKALPAPDFRPDLEHAFVAPQTAMEQEVAKLCSEVLNIKEIGIHDNFFCMGGNSLLAAQLIGYIRELFQIELPVRILFEHPTVEGLSRMLEMLQHEDTAGLLTEIDLQAEAILDPDIRPTGPYTGSVSNPQHIFLTGATGFLGAFLIHELLQQTQAMIHCLVRCANSSEGAIRLQETMEQYSLWDERHRDRLVPVPGDLAKPLLGLSERQFAYLANQIDVIYHNGALVNFVKPYSLLKAANVLGTKEILRLACQTKTKVVHHVSSDSVFGTIGHFTGAKVLRETDDLNLTEKILFLGYSQSKWVSEKLIQAAQSRGLPATIVRPGLILGHSKTGLTNLKDYPSRLIKGCIQIGCYPDLPNKSEYFVPIDYAGRAIVHLSRQEQSLGQIFHIVNPKPIQFLEFFQWIASYGYPLTKLPYSQWKERLIEHTRFSQENALYPLIPLIVEKVYQDKTLSELYQGHPYLDCSNTLSALAETEIACPAIDQQLRDTYFSYFVRSNFLKPPSGRSIISIGGNN
jgi:amino acid adenylation domain-containing protein/thioester reductase-like protein